jgi:hypothetical protein
MVKLTYSVCTTIIQDKGIRILDAKAQKDAAKKEKMLAKVSLLRLKKQYRTGIKHFWMNLSFFGIKKKKSDFFHFFCCQKVKLRTPINERGSGPAKMMRIHAVQIL